MTAALRPELSFPTWRSSSVLEKHHLLSPSEARTESKPPTQLSSRTKKPGDLATYEEIGKYSEFLHLRTLHEKLAKTKKLSLDLKTLVGLNLDQDLIKRS
jgi:hypothetical protein